MEHKRAKGNIGEGIACTFLKKKAFSIVERNYAKKWGEIDIIATKDSIIHFFEVKSVTEHAVSKSRDSHKPEDNVDGWKVHQIRRMIETYLSEKEKGLDAEFQFHVLCVFMNMKTRRSRVQWLKNVVV